MWRDYCTWRSEIACNEVSRESQKKKSKLKIVKKKKRSFENCKVGSLATFRNDP